MLWGCSVEPDSLKGEQLSDLAEYDLIVARESITLEALLQKGLPARKWCDPAFFLRREEIPLPQGWQEGKMVGVNVSPLILSRAKDGEAAMEAFVGLIRHILDSGEEKVALIPHVTWAHDNDMDALGRLKARFDGESRVMLLPSGLNAMQYKGLIARLKALVTARTHASIAGYSTGVPTLVIGYSVKARGIAKDLFGEEEGHLIPVQRLSGAEELIAAYDALIAREKEERAFLAGRLPEYMRGKDEIIRDVMALGERRKGS
ncbi:MAG: polysaccharide pyruvyl transferase family protein [Clostridia bacterium]|nr:polysaccharide pyruvyl transferase family protein [Clostridia bacterium]